MNNLDNLKALAANLPTGYKENAEALLERMGEVIEGIGDEPIVWKPNMLRLVQGTTDRGSIPKGTTIGDFVLGESRVERPLKFIPIIVWDGRQYWSPDQNESKMLCSSPDSKLGYIGANCNSCPHSAWNEEEKKSECGKVKQALVIAEDLSDVFQINFAKTNYSTGMELMSLMKKAGVAPYRRIYSIDSKTNSKNKNVENFDVRPADDRNVKAELLEFLGELFRTVQGDRKAHLEAFYAMIEDRRQKGQLQSLAAPDSTDATIALPGVSETPEVSELAKNYQI